ncbi:MAG: carboxylesterase family protein [Solirubrobacterales bacterium]|nr:carboxylesterase family protein [Solirubrobacterales bacterium]
MVLGLVGALGGFTSATALATAASPAAPPACTAGTLVQTQDGPVCGLVGNGVTSYLGIRFAAPPVGALRLATTGASNPVDDNAAGHPGGAQLPTANFPGSTPPTTSEDCLTLNVQVPTNAGSAPLPVMVGVHGGASCSEGPPTSRIWPLPVT